MYNAAVDLHSGAVMYGGYNYSARESPIPG